MPTYQYACTDSECGHNFEAVQAFTDAALTECPVCNGKVRKVFSAVGVVFKGSGFYRTDSRAAGSKVSDSKTGDSSTANEGSAKKGETTAKDSGKDSGKKETAATSNSSGSTKPAAAKASSGAGTAKSN